MFEIIDNIPIKSDESSDEFKFNIRKERKEQRHIPISNLPQNNEGNNFELLGLKKNIENTVHIDHDMRPSNNAKPDDSLLPSVPDGFRYLRDEGSWKSLFEVAKNVSISTQTDDNLTQAKSAVAQEIQTDMQSMVDIPRTQTFFTDDLEFKKRQEIERIESIRQQVLDHVQTMDNESVTSNHALEQQHSKSKGTRDSSPSKQKNKLVKTLLDQIDIQDFTESLDSDVGKGDFQLSKDEGKNEVSISLFYDMFDTGFSMKGLVLRVYGV